MFSPHYNCDIKSVNHIYSNAETGNFSSPELADYFIGDNLFVVLSECSNTLSVESKKTSCIRFLYKVYSRCKRIGGIACPYYNYIQRPGSLTYVYDEKIYHIIKAMDNIIDFYKENNIYDEYKEELEFAYMG